jgi:2-keto-myo-inositol isomerase
MNMERRDFLYTMGAAATASTLAASTASAATLKYAHQDGTSPWPLSMNTSTIRPATLLDKIDVTATAGFDCIELWMNDLEQYKTDGGSLEELRKRIEDAGLYVINVIGLWDCMPPDEAEFQKMMDTNKMRMEISARVGSKHVAVLPLPKRENFDIKQATARYRHILDVGINEIGILPTMEFVSVFPDFNLLGQAAQVAIDADHPQATILPDIFHLQNGGSGFNGIQFLQGDFISVFHWNDVPERKAPKEMGDADRIFPGDGVLPLEKALRDLKGIGYTGPLSLELFNRAHWDMDPKVVAEQGIAKMRAQIARALA